MARIGIDCRMYSSVFTGIGRYVYELTENLFKTDKKNEYVLFFNDPEYQKFSPPGRNVKKVLVNAPHYSFKEQTILPRLLNKECLDLMHFTHFNAPVLYNKPSVVTIHDLTLHFYPGKKKTSIFHRLAYKYIIGNALRKAKKVITVSENTKKDLQDTQKISSDKIAVIYEGVNKNYRRIDDKSVIEKVKDKYKLTRPYLLYTGVWRDHKNLPNLIEAFNILKNDFGFDGQLVITGRHDPLYASDIVGKAISLKLDNDVVFTGLVDEDELPPLYNGALIYVFPSLYEGFGLPPLEAMQCGTPVAASITSCIPEVCGKWNAVYFDPKDSSDMASKIFALISEKSLRERLIARGLEHVKNFSWEKMAEETLSVYNSILCGTPSKT